MSNITQRLEDATAKAENASAKLHEVVHGDASTEVVTESGSVPSVANWFARLDAQMGDVAAIPGRLNAIEQFDADLSNATDPEKGAGMVGFDNANVATLLGLARPLQTYAELVAYTGEATRVVLIGRSSPFDGGHGIAVRDDTVSSSDGATQWLDGLGRGWRRQWSGDIDARWWPVATDGVTDSYAALQAALTYAHNIGGGRVVFPAIGAPYCITETLQIGNDVSLHLDEWLKIIAKTTYDCAVVGIPGAQGWRVSNLRVDANNIPAQGGLYVRRNNNSVFVDRVEVINATHDKTIKGGRAVTVEAGVNIGLYGSRRVVINEIIARDCYNALTIAGGELVANASGNCVIGNIVAENCETVLLAFGNSAGYPHNGSLMQYIVHNISAKNCGKSTTYSRPHAPICADRGCNIDFGTISIVNDSDYGAIGAAMIGDFYNCRVHSYTFEGDVTRILAFGRFSEIDEIGDDLFTTERCRFNITHIGTAQDIVVSSKTADSKVVDCEINIYADVVTSGVVLTSQMAAKTRVYCRIYSKPNNAWFEGYANQIGSPTSLNARPGKYTHFRLTVAGLPVYADNAAATAGGLLPGDLYRTSTGAVFVRY